MTRRFKLFSVCPSAEVKPIKSLRDSDESLSPDCGPLFVTLKDHAGSFVMQKINSSLLAMGAYSGFFYVNVLSGNTLNVIDSPMFYYLQ